MTSEPRQGCGNQRRKVAGLGVAVLLALVPACGAQPQDDDSIPVQPSGDPTDPRLFQQTLYITDSMTDLALEGPGFLPVRTGPAVRYVRGGRFTFDDIGYLTDDRGRVLQVAPAHAVSYDVTGDVSTSGYWASCESTRSLVLEGNLDADAGPVPAFDEEHPSQTSNFNTSLMITGPDRLGKQVDIFFRHQREGTWQWFAIANHTETGSTLVASGILRFSGGNMIAGQTTLSDFIFKNGFQTIEINFGPATAAGSNSKGMTMQPAAAVITRIEADGGCVVDDLEVSAAGILSAQGASRLRTDIGRIPVVIFDHPEGLYEVEPGLYATTLASGPARLGAPGTKGRGGLLPGALESGVSACDQMRPDGSGPLCGSPRKITQ